MTTKRAPKPAANMALLRLNYRDYTLPMKDAQMLLAALEKVERYETDNVKEQTEEGESWQTLYYIGGDLDLDINITLLPEEHYLMGKLAGPRHSQK